MELQIEDSALVKEYISGNEKALEVLINRHNQRITSFIYSKVLDRDITEDIFQDTFIKVIKTLKKGNYSEEGKFLPWVMRIAHNLIIDHFRKEKQMNSVSNDDTEVDLFNSKKLSDKNVEEIIVNSQIKAELRMLINQLPPDQREVVLLRHYGELSFKEIADQTDVSINTALGRMRYALINLRKMIQEKELSLTAY